MFIIFFVSRRLRNLFFCVFIVVFFVNGFSQVSSVGGVVCDTNNMPIAGAYLIIDGGTYGTFTDEYGAFSLDLPYGEYVALVSSLGYKEKKVAVLSDSTGQLVIVRLEQLSQKLGEINVQGSKQQHIKKVESISVQLIEEEFLKESMASSLMHSLKSIPGINAMDAGTGISKPMIRGMGYYRVVVAQNGIKQEGQQWSNHHGIAVDQQSVDHVQIIKGPASLQYGSDAIGGVINILPAHVPLSGGLAGEASFVAKSNTRWYGGSGNISCRRGDIYALFSVTHNSYADFVVPKTDTFLLPSPVSSADASHRVRLSNTISNTAGTENASSATIGIIKPWGNSYIEMNYYATQSGFFDWQGIQNDSLRLIHQKSIRDYKRPWQKADNMAAHHFTNIFFTDSKLEIAFGYQNNMSKEFDYLDDRTGNRYDDLQKYRLKNNLDLLLNLRVWSANAFYSTSVWDKHLLKIGLNSQLQMHVTDGYNHILPQYSRNSAGVFATHRYSFSSQLIFNSGIRFDCNVFDIQETRNGDFDFGDSLFNGAIKRNYLGWAFSFGLNYVPTDNTIWKVNIGKTYRMPSAYELSAYGLHRHEGRFEKGNDQNNPEQAIQLDAGWEHNFGDMQVAISPFCNYFYNYLYLVPTPMLRPEGQVYEYSQTAAVITGGEASCNVTVCNFLQIRLDAEYVYAVNIDYKSALPFTPPPNILTQIIYQINEKGRFAHNKFGIEILGVAPQQYTVANELSTPGYALLGASVQSAVTFKKQKMNIYFKVSNVLNNRYYNHISFYRRLRIPESGRDLQLLVSVPF